MTTHEDHALHEEQTLTDSHGDPQDPQLQATETSAPVNDDRAVVSEEPAAVSQEPGAERPAESSGASVDPGPDAPETRDATGEPASEQMLFADDELADLRARWAGVQAAFVDDPKECVQKADGLVLDLVKQLTTGFANARSRLEDQWAQGQDASTEDLRVALMHYREFFERLLAV